MDDLHEVSDIRENNKKKEEEKIKGQGKGIKDFVVFSLEKQLK